MAHIYCAGPLFNPPEREEMAAIATALENAGHTTFLPQRDGLEFAELQPLIVQQGVNAESANLCLTMAIFALDVFMVFKKVDGVVANLNGRVPDEGMVVEAAISFSRGKPLVLYKSDTRSLINGSDNPLVSGLGRFMTVSNIAAIPLAMQVQLDRSEDWVAATCQLGADIEALRHKHQDKAELATALLQRLQA